MYVKNNNNNKSKKKLYRLLLSILGRKNHKNFNFMACFFHLIIGKLMLIIDSRYDS